MCARAPLVMSEDLLRDLAEYKTYKDKGVMMASRSLIQLFRYVIISRYMITKSKVGFLILVRKSRTQNFRGAEFSREARICFVPPLGDFTPPGLKNAVILYKVYNMSPM